MALNDNQKNSVKQLLHQKLEDKIRNYKPITTLDNHFVLKELLPQKVRRQFSAIHSLSTSLGMSVYEQISVSIAAENSDIAQRQWKSNAGVSYERKNKIEQIVREIANGTRTPNMHKEIDEILSIPNNDLEETSAGQIVDVYIKRGEDEYYADIKTVGPNKAGFLDHKRLTLMWVARANKKIHPMIALPYNPFHPNPYQKVGSNVMQVGTDLLVGKDYWDLVGGSGCYEDLVHIFKEEGQWYWNEMEKRF